MTAFFALFIKKLLLYISQFIFLLFLKYMLKQKKKLKKKEIAKITLYIAE